MGWTKRQLVVQAFDELGLASYVFDLTAEQLQSALRRMDAMIARWDGAGVELGYALPSDPRDSDLDTPSGIPDTAVQAVYLNLAVLLGPAYGKAIPLDLRTNATNAYDELVTAACASIPQQQYPGTLVRGAGNKPWRTGTPYMPTPEDDPLQVGDGGDLDFGD